MLRVGLTGGLGSGKSTAARMLAARGAHVLSSDEIGRDLMQPGQPVFRAVVEHFGPQILAPDGSLDRAALARIAFSEGRAEELNGIVHPAVIARQVELTDAVGREHPDAVVIVESALIFETRHAGPDGWRSRFDRIVLVRASEDLMIARFLDRTLRGATPTERQLEEHTAEARRRLARQIPDHEKAASADFVLLNDGSLADLEKQIDALWPTLEEQARAKSR